MDISDRLVNGQLGAVKHLTILNGKCEKIYILFDDVKAGNERKASDNFARHNGYVPIERTEAKFGVSNRKSTLMVTWTQFPIVLSYACTVHKVQGLTLEKIVVSFQLNKQTYFNPGQIYLALSRVTSLNGLYLTGDYSSSAIKANSKAELEYQRLRCKENLLEPMVSFTPNDHNLVLTLLNIRCLYEKLQGN